MATDGDSDALTLAEAAGRLGVRPQRINQMLKDGDLTGPPVSTETGRAPKNAPRVWEASVEDEVRRRAGSQESTRLRRDRDEEPPSESDRTVEFDPNPGRPADTGLLERLGALEQRVRELEARQPEPHRTSDERDRYAAEGRERAARAVAATLKASLDVATEATLQYQRDAAELRRENALLKDQLQATAQEVETMATLARSFGDSLTQLLGPDDPGSL